MLVILNESLSLLQSDQNNLSKYITIKQSIFYFICKTCICLEFFAITRVIKEVVSSAPFWCAKRKTAGQRYSWGEYFPTEGTIWSYFGLPMKMGRACMYFAENGNYFVFCSEAGMFMSLGKPEERITFYITLLVDGHFILKWKSGQTTQLKHDRLATCSSKFLVWKWVRIWRAGKWHISN